MVFDLIEQCVKRCECYSLLKSGELVFRGVCEKCTLRYEQIVFGCENKKIKLEFEEFKKFFNLIKKIGFSAINYIQLDIKVNEAFKVDNDEIIFLQYCIQNNIYKNYCLKELNKELNGRFGK